MLCEPRMYLKLTKAFKYFGFCNHIKANVHDLHFYSPLWPRPFRFALISEFAFKNAINASSEKCIVFDLRCDVMNRGKSNSVSAL